MNTIVLVSCSAKKGTEKAKAEYLYTSDIFKNSLAFARRLSPNNVYILSALHGILPLNKEIEPYDVTLSNVKPEIIKKKPHLKVLNQVEIEEWGLKVIEQLSEITDLKNDRFIILAGKAYIEPLRPKLTHIEEPLKRFRQGERIQYLKNQLQ